MKEQQKILLTDAAIGVFNLKDKLSFQREAILVRLLYPFASRRNIVGIHGPWHPDFIEGMRQLFNSDIDVRERLQRAGASLIMPSIETTLAHAASLPQQTYVVFHPDSGKRVLNLIGEQKLNFPNNVIAAIENDDSVRTGKYLDPGDDPRDPEVVHKLARKFEDFGILVHRIIDVEHLMNTYRNQEPISLLKRTRKKLGKINILHLSGKHHQGYSLEEIVDFTHAAEPETLVLEGPVPFWQIFSRRDELTRFKDLVEKIKTNILLTHR